MKLIIARILISAISLLLIDMLLPGIEVADNWSAIWVALLLALLNSTIRPVLVLLTLPVTIFSLGLFLFVINACMVLLASHWVKGFKVDSFWWALIFSFLLSIVNSIFQNFLLKGHQDKEE
ncbi:MAG: phage holin family protein [Chitinophagaceae bacterium]|jgi:putative membrane protein|nr:phage holin family protein [Chitinophagaceae bacterium]MCU0403020.1 phage holin family protein [Chitinophagaceae bacterium]